MEAVTTSQALGEQIQRFRVQRGLDQGDLAAAVGVDRTAVSKIESGVRRVSALELVKIAQALAVQVPDLMFQPAEPVRAARSSLGEFHDVATESETDRFEAEVQLDRLMRDAEQLRALGGIAAVPVPFQTASWGSAEDARELAALTRAALDVGDSPLGPMVEVCARFGLWVCPLDVQVDGLSATPERGFGVAVVASGTPGRRRSTAAHELGHHLSGDTYSTDPSIPYANTDREKLIELFAAELLLPQSAVHRRLVSTPPESVRDELIRICHEYRVSWSLGLRACAKAGIECPNDLGDTPTDADFLRVVGARPEPDLRPGSMARAWVRAAHMAGARGDITPRRAAELARTT